MGRKSLKEIRQKEIIRVFYKVAKNGGLENTSIALIAKEMDINPSLIIHYFQTKDDLIYGLIEYILEKYKLIFRNKNKTESKEFLVSLMDTLFSDKWNKLFDDSLFYSCYALTFRDAKTKAMYRTLLDYLRNSLAEILTHCDEEGELSMEANLKKADTFFVILDGAYFYLSLIEDRNEYNEKMKNYRNLVRQLLGF